MRNKDKPWFNDDCRLAFDIKHGAHLRWTHDRSGMGLLTGMGLSITRGGPMHAEAMHQFSVRSQDVLMNALCPHKWWSALKSAVFGSSSDSSLPPLIGVGGGLVCESVGKADMLSAHPLAIHLPVSLPLPSCHGR